MTTDAGSGEQPQTWTIAVVEDDDSMRQQIVEFIEGETFTFGKVLIDALASFEEALPLLRQRKIDLAILDVYRGEPGQHDNAGLEVLEKWQQTGFCPVILHTALPEGLEGHENAFVRLVPKEENALQNLVDTINALFEIKVPQLHRAISDHVESGVRDYMWGFVVDNWGGFEDLVSKPDFVRLLLMRLATTLSRDGVADVVSQVHPDSDEPDPDVDKVHPVEYYIKPPVGSDPQLGDLRTLERNGTSVLVVVLWPSCDLVEREGKCKVDRALCALANPLSDYPELTDWQAKQSGNKKKALESLLANNRKGTQSDRYHFLPDAWDIPASVIDFQKLEHVPVSDLRKASCLATIASPYAEAIGNRFGRYLGRIGTPDLDLELILTTLNPGGS
jgi:CheY-like chemotaxis protein